jgi:hypothetical protein
VSRLGETGQVYVTLAAARVYAAHEGLEIESARRELTEDLLDARAAGETRTGAERWRFRRRSAGVDISATVAREGRLAVVVAVSVRDHNVGGRRG